MKYEPIFGDQSLFDGAPEDADAVFKSPMRDSRCAYYRLSHGHERYIYTDWVGVPAVDSQTFNAMRRIIAEPKRWTVADQKAGRLPEVDCIVTTYDGKPYVFVGESCHNDQWSLRDCETGKVYHTPISWVLPVETPEEKAARLRSEWCSKAAKTLKNLEYSSTLTSLYDSLLSGELESPIKMKGGEQ